MVDETEAHRALKDGQAFAARSIEAFEVAEVSVVYDRIRSVDGQSRRVLIFAVVELLHAGLEAGPERPLHDGEACRAFERTHELNVRRVRMPVREALAWYRACAGGAAALPQTTGERARSKLPHSLELALFDEEPAFPNMVFDGEAAFWKNASFWGARPGGTRRHQLIPQEPTIPFRDWSEEARAAARAWLNTELPVDILERPRLLGSVHLVLTNPVFGDVHVRLNGSRPTQVLMDLQRWPGRPLPALKVFVRDDRPTGPATVRAFELRGASSVIDFPNEPHQLSYVITSGDEEILFASPPTTFLRQITIGMGVIGRKREVEVPQRSKARPAESYAVDVSSVEEQHIGDRQLGPALSTLIRDEAEARQRREASVRGQRWFDDDTDGATAFVRGLIAAARKTVLIVDSYFAATEVLRFACAPGVVGTRVQILTSKELLTSATSGPKQDPSSAAQRLARVTRDVAARDSSLTVEVRVALGERAPIHDRFIVIDNRDAWLIGSSLNELGARGTMVIRVPHPAPVILALEKVWAASPTVDDWLADAPGFSEIPK